MILIVRYFTINVLIWHYIVVSVLESLETNKNYKNVLVS